MRRDGAGGSCGEKRPKTQYVQSGSERSQSVTRAWPYRNRTVTTAGWERDYSLITAWPQCFQCERSSVTKHNHRYDHNMTTGDHRVTKVWSRWDHSGAGSDHILTKAWLYSTTMWPHKMRARPHRTKAWMDMTNNLTTQDHCVATRDHSITTIWPQPKHSLFQLIHGANSSQPSSGFVLFLLFYTIANSISVIYSSWYEEEKARAYTFTDSRDL